MNPEEKSPKAPEPEKIPIKSLRTYQGDVDEILSKGKASATTILIAEQKRREVTSNTQQASDPKVRNKFFIILGSTLFLLGIIAVASVYMIKANEKVKIVQKTKALIGFSVEKNISLSGMTKDGLSQKITAEKQAFNLPPNSVLYLNMLGADTLQADTSDVLKLLAPRMPASLSRSFENKYMLGIYSFDVNEPFIILTTTDFPSSFSGMLKWEKEIPLDLQEIFMIPNEIASKENFFEDEALRNKDLRILRDSNNNIVLLYSFIDKNTLVITGSENVFTAIIGKILINKQTE